MIKIITITRLAGILGLCMLLWNISVSAQGLMGFSDEAFVKEAAERGMAEVRLGKLAQNRGTSEAVRNFGKMMVTDHQKANDELKQLAQRKNIFVPAGVPNDMQKDHDDLSGKSAADFDEAFMKKMIRDHEATIALFKRAVDKGTDADLKSWAARTLPTLEQHLEHARNVQDNLKNSKKDNKKNKGK